MERYARMLLHFLHAITNDAIACIHFSSVRVWRTLRYLRYRDIDVALEKVAEAVVDWSGGTRIGECLHDFNRSGQTGARRCVVI